MRRTSRAMRMTSAITLVAYLCAFGPIPVAQAEERIPVSAGTLVMVRPTGVVSASTNKTGDTVEFVVVQDVKVSDMVVIKAGARARGQIASAQKAGFLGIPGRISVELQSVETVDGSMIPVRASKSMDGEDKIIMAVVLTLICLPFILIKGGNAEMSSSTTFDAFTLGTADVTIK